MRERLLTRGLFRRNGRELDQRNDRVGGDDFDVDLAVRPALEPDGGQLVEVERLRKPGGYVGDDADRRRLQHGIRGPEQSVDAMHDRGASLRPPGKLLVEVNWIKVRRQPGEAFLIVEAEAAACEEVGHRFSCDSVARRRFLDSTDFDLVGNPGDDLVEDFTERCGRLKAQHFRRFLHCG